MTESRDFSAMPILAAALQDVGFDCDDILGHCRSPGSHVRGCGVVDLVLGKESHQADARRGTRTRSRNLFPVARRLLLSHTGVWIGPVSLFVQQKRVYRMSQLVGQNCVRCGERLPSELDARFCRTCGSPVHDRCARPSREAGCPACGAAVLVAVPPPTPADTPVVAGAPKNATLAFTLNFFLPGSGLWYLGWPGWGLLNLAVVLVIGVVAALTLPDDVFDRNRGLLSAATAGGSAGLAMALANRRNTLGRIAQR